MLAQEDTTVHCANDKLITLTKVDNKDEKLAYVQVIDEHGCELSLSEVQELKDQRSLRAFVRGTSLDNFAGELNISPHTIYTHRKNIMRKLPWWGYLSDDIKHM